MRLKGEAAKQFVAELRRRHKKERQERLEKAKQKAKLDGKEPFDIDLVFKYFPVYEHDKEDMENPKVMQQKIEALEERYYVSFPDIMTIKEFGEKMCELRNWGAFD
ncbi:hypothetical protein [Microbulbifer sp. PSTR4-B]|uniref:hypothetical protein n=1 Tax=unclassified Microbulbifer TaxID=2619833 RepID=UPI004039C2C6